MRLSRKYSRQLSSIAIFSIFALHFSCGGQASAVNSGTKSDIESNINIPADNAQGRGDMRLDFNLPTNCKQGEDIIISYNVLPAIPDSVTIELKGKGFKVAKSENSWIIGTNDSTPVGRTHFKINVYKNGKSFSRIGSFMVYSANIPTQYKVKVVKTYPHSKNAYTQGLEFYNNLLYESSGEYGKSYLQSMEFPSMKVVRHKNMEANIFAEGITFIDNKMIMLTWQEYRALVFNPETFSIEKEFGYNSEGWGITNDGTNIYMSDGSQYIYIIEPRTFKQIGKLEVISGNQPVREINELEWIEGEIWANVFTTDNIIRINPKTGVVNSVIDASGLLSKRDYEAETNVLNGIAYNRSTKKIYITGKNWPKLFEISLVKK